jgi:hypothetical protein
MDEPTAWLGSRRFGQKTRTKDDDDHEDDSWYQDLDPLLSISDLPELRFLGTGSRLGGSDVNGAKIRAS